MSNSGLAGVLGSVKTGPTQKLPPTARKTPPFGWTQLQAYLAAGTFSLIVPENVWQLAFHVNGGGGNATTQASGAGGGLAYGVLDVVPGQLIGGIVVGGIAGTSSIAGQLSATGGTSAVTTTPGTAGAGTILNRALRQQFTVNGDNGGSGNSPGGNAGRRPNTETRTKSGLIALINGEVSGFSVVVASTTFNPVANASASAETGQDGQTGQSITSANNTNSVYAGRGGLGAQGGEAVGNGAGAGYGGPGGILGGGGVARNSATNIGGTGGPGGGGGVGSSVGGAGGEGIILIGWTPGY